MDVAKVIVFGGREYTDYNNVKEKLDFYLSNVQCRIIIVSGRCNRGQAVFITDDGKYVCGADGLGEMYAKEKGYEVIAVPADWDKHGKKAGWVRSKEMANIGTHAIGFWDEQSKGTKMMIDIAKEHGLKLKVVTYAPIAK